MVIADADTVFRREVFTIYDSEPEDLPALRRTSYDYRVLLIVCLRHPARFFGCFVTMKKNNTTLLAFGATAISLWAQNGFAQETLVTTASRFAEPVSSVLAPTSVVTREEIDRWQSKSVADVMRRLPGVDIAQNGGLGQQSSLFIRGTESRHVLVLVDGVRLNQAGISGSSDLSQIPISLVQRIEYVRGARSAVYGSDAIGGVVNIITGRDKPGTTLSAGTGSNGYQSYDGSTQQMPGNDTRVTLAGNYTYTKGFDVVANYPDAFGDTPQKDRDGFMSKTVYGAIEQQFNDEFSGFVRGYGFDNRTAYDGSPTYVQPDTFVDTRQLYSQTWDSGLKYNNGDYSSRLVASYSHAKDYNYSPDLGRYASSASLDDSQQYNLQWGNNVAIGNGSVSGGVDWQKQTIEPGTAYVNDSRQVTNTGLYATAQQKAGTVTLEGALRGDDHSEFGWHETWQTSAAWEFVEGYRLLASYGTAFKAPTLGQLYGSFGGNSDLNPEESKQWEAGVEGLTGPVSWHLSGYKNLIDSLIDYNSATNNYFNVNKAAIKGLEATASFDTGPVTHQLSYDYIDARNAETDEILLRRAKQQVKYQLDWTLYEFDWAVSYHYSGQRYDRQYAQNPDGDIVKLGGVNLWDLAVSYPVTSQLIVRGRIANLFDKDYETVYGYQTAGREYYLTGSYTF